MHVVTNPRSEGEQSCCAPSRPTTGSTASRPLTNDVPGGSTDGMVLLDDESFLMGSEDPISYAGDGEGPVRRIKLAPFWIDVHAVTNAEFARFIEDSGHVTEAETFGWSFVFGGLLPDDFAVALDGLEHAVAIDPEYALAWAMLAQLYLDAEAFGFPGVTDGSSKGMAAARRAVQLDPQSQWAQCSAAYANLVQGDAEAVCRHSRCAIELNPNSALAVGWAGWSLCAAGEFEEGLAAMGHAIELNPYHPSWYHTAPCFSAMARGAFDEAVEHAGNVGMPGFFWDPLLRAAALGLAGKSQQARGAADELLAINPQFHIDGLNAIRPIVLSEVVRERLVEGMAVAGIVLAPLPVASHHAAGM